MARKASNSRKDYPLSAAFPGSSPLAVLRMLSHTNGNVSVRTLARMAGIHHRTCLLVLRSLERNNLVDRLKIGKSSIARLNEENAIVSELILPLLDRERQIMQEIEDSIHRSLGEKCGKIRLKGVMAGKGQVDAIADPRERGSAREAAEELPAGLAERYGFEIKFNIFTYNNLPLDFALD